MKHNSLNENILPQMHQNMHVQHKFSDYQLSLSVFLSLHTVSVPVHVTASAVNLGHRVCTDAGQQRPLFSVRAFHLVAPKSRGGYGYT